MHEHITLQTGEERQADRCQLDSGVAEAVARTLEIRCGARSRYDEAVYQASTGWRESFGYKAAPVLNNRETEIAVREMVGIVLKGRLMMMFTPFFAYAESIERSLLIIGMLASPSNSGPERYAPKKFSAIERIKV